MTHLQTMRHWRLTTIIGLLTLGPGLLANRAQAQVAPSESDEQGLFQLDDQLKAETNVASMQQQSIRESPGVLTIISREEILASGARDLMDVLALVPGFWFGTDVQGVTDVGFRGMWAHEGKMLLMVDGIPVNELAFNTNQLGHHYPVEQLKEIEIIRGPGSAIYGGMAELCVVNLVFRDAKSLHGSAVTVGFGQLDGTFGHADVHLATGQEDVDGILGLSVSGAASVGRGLRSSSVYSDFSGNSYSLVNNAEFNPVFVNLAVNYKKLTLRLVHDHYALTERDSFGTALAVPTSETFTSTFLDGAYVLELGKLSVIPRLTYTLQLPWDVTNPSVPDFQDITVSRLTARLVASYAILEHLSLMVGTEDYTESTHLNRPAVTPSYNFFGPQHDQPSISYWNLAAFSEVAWDSFLGHLTVGARLERHKAVGNSFVPRAAYTRIFGDFNLKLLYSYAFRAPGVEPINDEPPGIQLKPERTRDAEIEVGYRATSHLFVSANVFDITIRDPVVYSSFGSASAYQNFSQTGTQGFELQGKLVHPWGFVNANYSYYSSRSVFDGKNRNEVTLYSVPGSESELAAFPTHKVAVSARVKVGHGLSLDPSAVFLSARSGQISGDGAGNGIFGKDPATTLFNVLVSEEDLLNKNLTLSVGVMNALNSSYRFIQPYSSGHAPIPGPTREFVARAALAF